MPSKNTNFSSKFPRDKITLVLDHMIICFCLEYVFDSKIFFDCKISNENFQISNQKFQCKAKFQNSFVTESCSIRTLLQAFDGYVWISLEIFEVCKSQKP